MTLVLLVFQVIFEELSIAWILDWVQSFDAQCIGIDTGYVSIFAVRFDHLYFIAPAPVLRLQHEVKARKMRERQTISHLSSSLKSLRSSYPTWNTLVPSSVQSIGSKKRWPASASRSAKRCPLKFTKQSGWYGFDICHHWQVYTSLIPTDQLVQPTPKIPSEFTSRSSDWSPCHNSWSARHSCGEESRHCYGMVKGTRWDDAWIHVQGTAHLYEL